MARSETPNNIIIQCIGHCIGCLFVRLFVCRFSNFKPLQIFLSNFILFKKYILKMNKSGSYVIVCFLVSDTCIFEGVVHGAFIYIYKKWYIKQLTKTGHGVTMSCLFYI